MSGGMTYTPDIAFVYKIGRFEKFISLGIFIGTYQIFTQLLSGAYSILLYRHECFTEKYSTRKFRTKLHPGYE